MASIGALLFTAGGQGRYIRASIAVRITPTPPLTQVPGAPAELLGIALHEGVVVPVLAVGPARGDMVVCAWDEDMVGLVGGEGFETGTFEPPADGTRALEHRGRRYLELDVPSLCSAVVQGGRHEHVA